MAVIVFSVILFAHTLVRALFYTSGEQEARISASVSTSTDYSIPTRLLIPKIHVDAKVLEMGLTTKGNMEAPHNFTDVGWYKYGPKPGEMGSAVIDGHVDNGLSLPAVFIDLKKLTSGDDIYVTEGDKTLHFVVQNVERYYYKSAPTDIIFNRTDLRRLNLITCDGDWVTLDKTADHRVVVYAVLKE